VIQLIYLISLPSGASITTCRGLGHHIMALEENKDIFDTIFKPMRKSTPTVVVAQALVVVSISKDPNDIPMVAQKFSQKGKFNK